MMADLGKMYNEFEVVAFVAQRESFARKPGNCTSFNCSKTERPRRVSTLSKVIIFLTILKKSGKAGQFKTVRGTL
ncbi:hypothetical protein X777_01082 [Ooceraea biroi]|uniref:Uncharacterized protein n=1 Tax=Ooceraea biroi TaxID=2015173 RepID=A0A026VT02_OOCBI|nr:hypothetical protein X777_01082 [Ooceraea biroi]